MKPGKFLIAGGYGTVGRIIAGHLANTSSGQVIVAGRDRRKAEDLAAATGHNVLPMAFDVASATLNTSFANSESLDPLEGVAAVVMCLDQPNTRFVELCLHKGINYVDITASYDFLVQVEKLQALAVASGSTAVLSVGLAPGLTNLLARHARSQFEELQHVDIHVLLGLGEAHGEAAVRWIIQNMNMTYNVLETGTIKRVESFEDGKQAVFPGKLGKRTTYRFNFADQHVLPRTLHIDSVSTRLGFDSAFVTRLLALLKQSGAFAVLRYRWVEDALVRLFRTFHFGSEQFVVQIDAHGVVDGRQRTDTYAIAGRGEGRMTGLVAAQVVEQLVTTDFPSGVFHIEQLFEPPAFIEQLLSTDLYTSGI